MSSVIKIQGNVNTSEDRNWKHMNHGSTSQNKLIDAGIIQ